MKPIFYCQATSAHQGMISSLQLNPFSSALSVVFKCFMHAMSSFWKPHECYLLFMPSELLLIILWQCLEGSNKIRAISASHCPSRVAASKQGSSISELRIHPHFHSGKIQVCVKTCPGFHGKESLVHGSDRSHGMALSGAQGTWLEITMLVCHKTVEHSSFSVIRNEAMPKRENELKD